MQYLHSMVRVRDLETSLRFYRDALGLIEVSRMTNDRGRFTLVFLAASGDVEAAQSNRAPLIELTWNWDYVALPISRNFGQAQAIAPADAAYLPSDPQIAWHLARFVEEVRSIPADPIVLRQNWLKAYDFTTDKGAAALNNYARVNDPFARVGKEQVAVDVSSVIRASNDSFRIAWVERRYVDGALATTERWSAIVTLAIQTPHDAERLKKNPLGIYVHALNWSKELG